MTLKPQYTLAELTDRYFLVYWYRKHLDIAARDILGLDLASHHSIILRDWGHNKIINYLLSSRGMGKSVLMAIYILLLAILYPTVKIIIGAGTAFRGSKMLLLEIERIMNGFLSGQRKVDYARYCLADRRRVIIRDPSYWQVVFSNGSFIYAIPLGANSQGDSVRGLRATVLGMDEAFLIPTKLRQAALEPMQNVLYDPSLPADKQPVKNSKIMVSTIDFDFRDFWKDGQYYKALVEGAEFKQEEESEELTSDDVSWFEFNIDDTYYTYQGEKKFTWGINYDTMVKTKNLPSTDIHIWLAENKNIPQNIEGGYFDYEAIDRGMKIELRTQPEENPQVLDSCAGPCILGIDTAPEDDNSAFVVIKAGTHNRDKDVEKCKVADMGQPCPLLKGTRCLYGKHVPIVYAYQENKMSQIDRVIKIYELMEQFNIIGIAMDSRGGGRELSDLLKDKNYIDKMINQNDEITINHARPIYDPEEVDSVAGGMPLLRLYSTTQAMNMHFNGYMKAIIANNTMLFPMPQRAKVSNRRLAESAGHAETLVSQIARIKAIPKGNSISYIIETVDPQTGKPKQAKKDLYSACLYATARLREMIEESREKEEYNTELALPVGFRL